MKIATVKFMHVRDCPNWIEGDCTHDDGPGKCCVYELSDPPMSCPLPNVKDGPHMKDKAVTIKVKIRGSYCGYSCRHRMFYTGPEKWRCSLFGAWLTTDRLGAVERCYLCKEAKDE